MYIERIDNLDINSADHFNNKNWILFIHAYPRTFSLVVVYTSSYNHNTAHSTKKCGYSQYILIMPNTNRY